MSRPSLSTKQLAFLRSRAHPLEPRLQLGKAGAGEGFRRELAALLAEHELVKLRVGRRVQVDLPALAAEMGASLVQRVGHTCVLYRPAAEPKLELPAS